MINYYLINNKSTAAEYGIGTYTKQIYDALIQIPNIKVYFIDLHTNTNEYSIFYDECGCIHYNIPMVRSAKTKSYYRNASYFLMQVIPNRKYMIFHFNYFQNEYLALLLKEKYINSSFFFTVHYLNWSFLLKGNISNFIKIVSNNGHNLENKLYKTTDKFANYIVDQYLIERSKLRVWDEIIVLSNSTYNLLTDIYKVPITKLHTIYNGLNDTTTDSTSVSTNNFMLKYFNILFVGRLDDNKGVEFVIKSFINLARKYDHLRLTIVGGGDFDKYLSLCTQVRDKVIFTGKISQDELKQYYMHSKLGLLPSFTEQCSYTVIEMMKFGLPVIISDSTGLKEMLPDGSSNIVHIDEEDFIEEDFIAEISSKIECHITDEKFRSSEAQKARACFEKKYQLDYMQKSLEKLIDSTINERQYCLSEELMADIDSFCINVIHSEQDYKIDDNDIVDIARYLVWRESKIDKSNKNYCRNIHNALNKILRSLSQIHNFSSLTNKESAFVLKDDCTKSTLTKICSKLKSTDFQEDILSSIIKIYNINYCI